MNDAGWGPRPFGKQHPKAEDYDIKVSGSTKSLYVGPDWTEFDGLRKSDMVLIDAKYAHKKDSYYDRINPNHTWNPDSMSPSQEKLAQALRQVNALKGSGARGIEWITNKKSVQLALQKLFARNGVPINVTYRAG